MQNNGTETLAPVDCAESRKSHSSTAMGRRKVSKFYASFEEGTSNFIKNLT